MLDTLFFQILRMSLMGSLVILLVLIARLLLKRAPKIFSYTLWGVVLFRLLCPFAVKSNFSIFGLHNANNYLLNTPENFQPEAVFLEVIPKTGSQIFFSNVSAFTIVWLIGIIFLLSYSLVSYLRLRKKLKNAVKLYDNVYCTNYFSLPFVAGLISPKIYLPTMLSEHEQKYIILHEKTHIQRFDYVFKMMGFVALLIHWFNPLVWLAFTLGCQDMEMSCDESVMRQMKQDIRKEYSASLLGFATGKRYIGMPLAFGEGNIKMRIKNILNYKKAPFWVILVSVSIVIIIVITLATNPSDINDDTQITAQATSDNAEIVENDGKNKAEIEAALEKEAALENEAVLQKEAALQKEKEELEKMTEQLILQEQQAEAEKAQLNILRLELETKAEEAEKEGREEEAAQLRQRLLETEEQIKAKKAEEAETINVEKLNIQKLNELKIVQLQ